MQNTTSTETLQYASDRYRLNHLTAAVAAPVDMTPIDRRKLLDTWDGYDDLTQTRNLGDRIVYQEGFVDSCWRGVYIKPEYKGLTRAAAVEKLVTERLAAVALIAGLVISKWEYKRSVLSVELVKPAN